MNIRTPGQCAGRFALDGVPLRRMAAQGACGFWPHGVARIYRYGELDPIGRPPWRIFDAVIDVIGGDG